MKITTTFWSDEIHEFHELLYINGNTREIMFSVDLNDMAKGYAFFSDLAKFVKTSKVRKTMCSDYDAAYAADYYQFAVMYDGEICPIKWFDLVVTEKLVISHDIAFETTLINKNNVLLPFGKFPMWCKQKTLPKYREFNIKFRAYKYMANQIKKLFGY